MNEPTHTKAPWLLAENGSPFVYALNDRGFNRFWLNVYSGTHGDSEIQERTSNEEIMANARLIAAAPDLLEALDNLLNVYAKEAFNHENLLNAENKARAAIIKARGE